MKIPNLPATLLLLPLTLALSCGPEPSGGNDGGPDADGGSATDGGGALPTLTWSLGRTLGLGTCQNAGALKVVGTTAYVSCGGNFTGNGELVIVDLDTFEVKAHAAVGGAPGALVVAGDRVYLGDMSEGRILVAGTDGSVIHDANDGVLICPSDFANNVYQFIADIEVIGDVLYASCFASDEVVALRVSAGADPGDGTKNAEILGRVNAGDGISALEPWHTDDFVGLENLAGMAAHVATAPFGAAVDYWQVGEVPNDLRIEGDLAYVVNSGSNTLQVLDLAAVKTTAELNLGDGTNPWSLARLPDGTTAVTLQSADAVAFVDAGTTEITQTVAMPAGDDLNPYPEQAPLARPQGIAAAGDDRLLVSLTNFDANFSVAAPGMLVELVGTAQ